MYHATEKQLIYLRVLTTTLLIIGGIAWGIIGSIGFNPISRLCKHTDVAFLSRLIYLVIGVAAVVYLYLFYNTKTFLPFLNESLFPSQLITVTKPLDYNHEVILNAPNDANMVVYWTSSNEKQFENAAATKVKDGRVTLNLRDPNNNFRVYYRWITNNSGILSKVNTVDV